METSIADRNGGPPVGSITAIQSQESKHPREGLTAVICLFTFVGTAAATLIVCGLTPARPIPEGWHQLIVNRTNSAAKWKAKGASAANGSSPL